MKRLTALGICALLLVPTALAGLSFNWDAAQDQYWQTLPNNWAGRQTDGKYPGSDASDDSATINTDTAQDTIVVNGTIPNTVGWVVVDAATAGVDLMLQITSSGDLDVNGELELNASTLTDAEAELEVASGGAFEANSLDLNGGNSENRCAVLDLDESVTVQSSGSDFDGFCDIDVASGKTFTALATTINASRLASDVMMGYDSGTGTLSASSLTITAGNTNDYDARFRHSDGTTSISGELEMNASTSANAEAELYITDTNFSCGSLDLNGGTSTSQEAVLDIDQSVTVGDSGTTMSGYISIDVADSQTFDLDDVTIDSTSANVSLVTSGTCQSDSLTINASTDDQALTITGGGTLDSIAVTVQSSDAYSSSLSVDTNTEVRSDTFSTSGNNASDQATVSGSGRVSTRSMSMSDYSTISVSNLAMVASSSASSLLTLPVSNVTFSPSSLELQGYNSTYRTTLNIDGTLDMSSSTLDVSSFVNMDVATGYTFTSSSTTVDASSGESDMLFGYDSGTGTFSTSSLTITAGDSADYDARYRHSDGTTSISGELEMNASTSANAEAELYITDTNFSMGSLDANGGNSSSRRAVLDFNESVTVQSTGSSMTGYVDIDVENSDTFSAGSTQIGDGSQMADVQFGFDASPGDGTFSASTLTIQGADESSEYAHFNHTNGYLTTSGLLEVREGSYGSDHSDYGKLTVGANSDGCTPNSMELEGYAELDMDANVTVSSEFKVTSANSADPVINLADNTTLSAGRFTIDASNGSVTVVPTFGTSAHIQTN